MVLSRFSLLICRNLGPFPENTVQSTKFLGKGLKFAIIACGGRVTNHNFWREKGPKFQFFDSELLAGEGSQITTNWREKGLK